jgi:hypothetical protein
MDWAYRALGVANERAQAIEHGLRRQKQDDLRAARINVLARGLAEAVRSAPDLFGGELDYRRLATLVVDDLLGGGR